MLFGDVGGAESVLGEGRKQRSDGLPTYSDGLHLLDEYRTTLGGKDCKSLEEHHVLAQFWSRRLRGSASLGVPLG